MKERTCRKMECDILAMTKNIATNLSDYERMFITNGRRAK